MLIPTETDVLLGKAVRADSGVTDYLFESKLGVGGTAAAYLAQRISAGGRSPAVVKVILPEVVDSQGATAAAVFLKEAVALGRLNERTPPSPFVVRLLDVGRVTIPYRNRTIDVPWLAIEYVSGGSEGTTLRERVTRAVKLTGYAFDRERAARALRHISEGLAEVHAVEVIHRDLTPGNVLCCNAGSEEMFKISDFGIARPQGVAVTFGPSVVGTPGYMAPEQITDSKASIASDVFSLACMLYFILTGEEYVPATDALQTLARITSGLRPKLADAAALCPELRQDEAACALIDDWLARATASEPERRPPSARVFASAIVPSLAQNAGRGSERYLSILRTQLSPSLPRMDWVVRHPPGDRISVHVAAWDSDGQCLAITDAGMRYWDGCTWSAATLDGLAPQGQPRFVRRAGAGRWLSGGPGATLFEYSRRGVERIVRGKHPEISFSDASGSLDDLVVVVGQAQGSPPLLLGLSGGRWLRPLPLPAASVVNALVRVDDERWLVVGRGTDGRGLVALYSPLDWSVELLPAPATRAYLACASRSERDVTLAVGTEGNIARLERGVFSTAHLDGSPDLVCAAIDVLDREWVGALGGLWASAGGVEWQHVWGDPAWTRPFMSIHADVASVVAMSADGGVLECRALLSGVVKRP